MIGTQDKRFGVADHDVQPMKKAGIGIVGFMFMGVALQGRNIITIASLRISLPSPKAAWANFFTDACLILGVTRIFRKRVTPRSSKDSATKTFTFSVPCPRFSLLFDPQSTHVKFDDPAQLMGFIPLAHGNANASEHGPCSFVGSPKHRRQLHSRNASLILTHKIERQKPLPQRHMCLMQHRPCRYRGLTAALGALISPVRQPVSMTAAAFGANIPSLPALRYQVLLALRLAGKPLQKCPKWQTLFLCHDSFPRFPVSWHYPILRHVP